MRIAIFTGNYNYVREGANQALNKLTCYLEASEGCQVRAYSPVTETPAFEPAGTLIPVPSVALPIRNEFRLALGLPRNIRRDLALFRPDIVHVATPDILGTRAQTFAMKLGVPVVASMHTRFETYLDYYGLGWARPLAEAHLHRFYRRSDHVLAPTPALVADLKAARGDGNVSLWSRGIDRGLFSPERRDTAWRRAQGLSDEEFVVLYLGRLVLEKGLETFVAIMRTLQAKVRARALVVGSGPAGDVFRSLPGTVLTGHLDGHALARAVASADAMLCPSTTEAFGNVVLEAMACALPVVCADAPSARMLVRNGETGFLCAPGAEREFGERLAALAASRNLGHAMGSAAREASKSYSWDAASRAVADVYKKVSGRRA